MTPTNHFFKDFDEETKIKLQLFRMYIAEWIPVFLTKRESGFDSVKTVAIYDFFSGYGCDTVGTPGSPLIIIDELKKYCRIHSEKRDSRKKIRVVLNDKDKQAIEALKENSALNRCDNTCCNIEIYNNEFQDIFRKELPNLKNQTQASLVLMDQFGLTDVDPEIINQLATSSKTDFIFFISSSQARRFSDQKGIVERFPNLTQIPLDLCHKKICDFFMKRIDDKQTKCRLIPFSLKKGSNVYGIIFGSSHALGIEKFLTTCWNIDPVNGEANYDIENDGEITLAGQGSLFDYASGEEREMFKYKKKTRFKKQLLTYIKENNETPVTNVDVYHFTIDSGFLPEHAREILKELMGMKQILALGIVTKKPTATFALNYKAEPTVHFVWNTAPVQTSLF